MATACVTTMALWMLVYQLKKWLPVLQWDFLEETHGVFAALTDINAFEDAFGLMDFKVIGTDDGITAIQMDVKYKGGLPREVFEQALSKRV